MRPAFVLLAITAFTVARPLDATHPKAVGLQNVNYDLAVEHAWQEWLATQDEATIAALQDGRIWDKLKSAAKSVAKAAAPHLKNAAKTILDKAHAKISAKLAGAAAGGAAADAATDAPADAPPAEDAPAAAERRSIDAWDAAVESALQEWLAEQDAETIALLQDGLWDKIKAGVRAVAKAAAPHLKSAAKAVLDKAHAHITAKLAGGAAADDAATDAAAAPSTDAPAEETPARRSLDEDLVEQAFQDWLAVQDDALIAAFQDGLWDKIKAGVRAAAKAAAPHLKSAAKAILDKAHAHITAKLAGGAAADDAATDAAAPSTDAPAEDAPARRSVDNVDAAVELALQQWLAAQDEATIAALQDGLFDKLKSGVKAAVAIAAPKLKAAAKDIGKAALDKAHGAISAKLGANVDAGAVDAAAEVEARSINDLD